MAAISPERGLRFVVDASEALGRSLDYEETLGEVANLAVPLVADWFAVDVIQPDQSLKQITSEHPDPEQQAFLMELRRRFRAERQGSAGVARVIHTGESELREDVRGLAEIELAAGEEEMYDRLAARSYLIVPMTARGATIGALTLLSTAEGRHYDAEDVAFAEYLGRKLASAIESSRLHGAVQRANDRLEFLARASAILSATLDADVSLREVAELAVPTIADRARFDTDARPARSTLEPQRIVVPLAGGGATHGALVLERDTRRYDRSDLSLAEDLGRRAGAAIANTLLYRQLSAREAVTAHELSLVVENVQDYGIFMLDPTGHVMTWNRGAERLFGYTADEILGQPLAPTLGAELEEQWLPRKDGTRFLAAIATTPLHEDDGTLVGYGRVIRDVTEARATEAELRRSNQDLGEYASIVSHDLREPLRLIDGFSELAGARLRNAGDEDGVALIDRIRRAVERMQALITALRTYAEVGGSEVDLQPTDLNRVVENALLAVGVAVEESGAEVTVGALPEVIGDEQLLEQLLQNLLANALKFTDAQPVVGVGAERDGERWLVHVDDNGIGIAPGDAERIFGMLTRLHGQDDYPGAGIGLAVCQRIVELHGGTIAATPREEGGTRFSFDLSAAG
jgi:signal transduction histidine kinase/GAF domain-containing protein